MRSGTQTRTLLALALLCALGLAPAAQAQINLPQLRVPNLPVDVNKTLDVNRTLGAVTDRLDLRKLQLTELARAHRDVIERDPQGELIVRNEVTAFSPTDEALARAKAAGFAVARERVLEGLDAKIVVLLAPSGMSTRAALRQLRKWDPDGVYDFNHIYGASGSRIAAAANTQAPASSVSKDQGASALAGGIKVGLIDGGVDVTHAVFREAKIKQYGCGGSTVPSAHGTAVASLIAGRSERFHGALPGAVLYAVDVYCGKPTGGAVDAVADAFAWLARERVPTINVSLVGPSNATLQSVVRVVTARGFIIVAAVGNDGPAAPPLYPASYPDVVGVTGVDLRQRALLEAARGEQVDFAAPGADMAAAGLNQSYEAVRGTSFAAPFVAGLLASEMSAPDKAAAERAIASLAQQAVDLGSPGLDKTYGRGLVGNTLRMEPALAKVHEN